MPYLLFWLQPQAASTSVEAPATSRKLQLKNLCWCLKLVLELTAGAGA